MRSVQDCMDDYGIRDKSRRVQKLASNLDYRWLHLLILGEVLEELKAISGKLDILVSRLTDK